MQSLQVRRRLIERLAAKGSERQEREHLARQAARMDWHRFSFHTLTAGNA